MAETAPQITTDNLVPRRMYSAEDETRHKPADRVFTWEELKLIWGGVGEQQRRAETARMLEIYGNEWLEQLNQLVRANHIKQNQEKVLQKADTTWNALRSVAKELGGIYDVPAMRTVRGENGEETAEGLEPYIADGALDDCLAELAPLCWVSRELFVRPHVRYDGQIVLDSVTPDRVSFVQNKTDPTMMDAIIIDLGKVDIGATVEQRYEAWTTETYAQLDEHFLPIDDEKNPKHNNPFKLIPWVKVNANYPARGKWHLNESFGVRDATLILGGQKTNFNHLRFLQSHKQLVATSDQSDSDSVQSKLKLVSDPLSCIHWRNGKIDVLDLQAHIREQLETLIESMDMILNQEGINADVARGKMVASSGYALLVSMHKQRKAWAKYQRSWYRAEKALYRVAQVVHPFMCKQLGIVCNPLPAGDLVVSYGDLGPESNPLEQAQLAKELQAVGWSKQATWREIFGKDDDWIAQNLQELDDEREAASPFPDGPPMNDPAAPVEPDTDDTDDDDDEDNNDD